MLSCTFKYGQRDVDVMGVAFRRDLFVVTRQVYPELLDKEQRTHSKVQRRLLHKLGDDAFPFFFEVSPAPQNLRGRRHQSTRVCASVSRQPAVFGGPAARRLRCGEGNRRRGRAGARRRNLRLTDLCHPQKCAVEFEVKGFCAQNQDQDQDQAVDRQ